MLQASHIFENVTGSVSLGSGQGDFEGVGLGRHAERLVRSSKLFYVHLKITGMTCLEIYYMTVGIMWPSKKRVSTVGEINDLVGKHNYSWDWYDKMLQGGSDAGADAISMLVRDIMEPPDSSVLLELSLIQGAKLQDVNSNMNGGVKYARTDIDAKAPTLISAYRISGHHTSNFILY